MTDALPIDRFYDLVASYGANLDRWPADFRNGAVRCLVDSEAARTAWQDAADLDAELDAVTGADITPALAERVLAIGATPETAKSSTPGGLLLNTLPYAAAAAVALMIGIVVPSPFRDAITSPQPVDIATIEPSSVDENVADLNTLALVDVSSLGDSETDAETASDNGIQLTQLPLL